jgi:hypothetical protein
VAEIDNWIQTANISSHFLANLATNILSSCQNTKAMKKYFTLLMFVITGGLAAQNVGIGTSTPGFRLDVVGRMRIQASTLGNASTGSGIWFTDHRDNSNIVFIGMADTVNYGLWSQRAGIGWQLFWDARYGSLGLGSRPKSASEKLLLDYPTGAYLGIYNNGTIGLSANASSNSGTVNFYSSGSYSGMIGATDSTLEIAAMRSSLIGGDPAKNLIFWPPQPCTGQFCIATSPGRIGMFTNTPNARVHIVATSGTSGVLIGATSLTPATGYMLNVGGKAISEELKVQLNGSWPDYVFEPDYPMPTLEALENQVMEQKHLPGIPSASQVTAENGFEVGATQTKLLEKVEELYRYVFDLNKKLNYVVEENARLKAQLVKKKN